MAAKLLTNKERDKHTNYNQSNRIIYIKNQINKYTYRKTDRQDIDSNKKVNINDTKNNFFIRKTACNAKTVIVKYILKSKANIWYCVKFLWKAKFLM